MNDLKPFAALGPGDIVGARRSQTAGNAIKETSIAFSEQLFSYCEFATSKRSRFLQTAESTVSRMAVL
jgi:hypothetical protein